jgi:hypothetical protein
MRSRRKVEQSTSRTYDYYSLVLGYWGMRDMKTRSRKIINSRWSAIRALANTGRLNERTIEWTPLERRAMHETYVLWSKAWKP